MKASKFPVTYRGEQFRVSVADASDDRHLVKVYVKGRLGFRRVARYFVGSVPAIEDDVIISAKVIVRNYVKLRDEDRERGEQIAQAWRNFTQWDGEVGDK